MTLIRRPNEDDGLIKFNQLEVMTMADEPSDTLTNYLFDNSLKTSVYITINVK